MPESTKTPWNDIEVSLKFTRDLSAIALTERNSSDNRADVERLLSLLKLLKEYVPSLQLATLWKVKNRARAISAICRVNYNPDPVTDPTEFVSPLLGTHANILLERAISSGKMLASSKDITKMPIDLHFNRPEIIRKLNLKRQLLIPFSVPTFTDNRITHFITIYLDDKEPDYIHKYFIDSIVNKLKSGVAAIINKRLNNITSDMTNIVASGANITQLLAFKLGVQHIVPKHINCDCIVVISRDVNGNYKTALSVNHEGAEISFSKTTISKTAEYLEEKYLRLRDDVFICSKDDIAIISGLYPESRSCAVACVKDSMDVERLRGFFILINKVNDLAISVNGNQRIDDYFDWEDEVYLSHIASVLDLVAEITVSSERLQRLASVLAHEMQTPTNTVYATAERLLRSEEGDWKMPPAMKKAELRDILLLSEWQSSLVQSMVFGLKGIEGPPSKRYSLEYISDLKELIRNVVRMLTPLCKKAHIDPTSITISGSFPNIHFDKSGFRQVVMNLVTNAIKYRDRRKKADIEIRISCDHLSIGALSVHKVPEYYHRVLIDSGVRFGYLLEFRDNGIGVKSMYRERVFEAGMRDLSVSNQGVTGAGLGLYITRNILRDHGCEIWLDNDKEPTSFCVFLPDFLTSRMFATSDVWLGRSVR